MTEHVLDFNRVGDVQSTYYWCGPTTTHILLSIRGIDLSQQDCANELGTTVDGTAHIGLVATVLNNHLPEAHYSPVFIQNDPPTDQQKEDLWSNIVASINAGYGCGFNICVPPSNYPRAVKGSTTPAYGGGTVYHYIAGAGYDDDPALRAVYIADPGFRPFEYWVSLDQLITMIPPKGYTSAHLVSVPTDPIEELLMTNQDMFNDIHREDVTQQGPSRSFMADGGGNIDSPLGIAWNSDGNLWNVVMTNAYLFDVPYAVKVVEYIAQNGVYPASYAAQSPFLASFGQAYCQGLVKHKAALKKLLGMP